MEEYTIKISNESANDILNFVNNINDSHEKVSINVNTLISLKELSYSIIAEKYNWHININPDISLQDNWNEYIEYINKTLITLDNNPNEQFNAIIAAYHTLSKEFNDYHYKQVLNKWVKSWMIITHNEDYGHIFDIDLLYPFHVDLKKISALCKQI